jgi:ribonuclease Z
MNRLIALGTGEAIVCDYYNTCFVITDDDGYFLTDGGSGGGILRQVRDAGLDWNSITNLFITHEHTDHILGMVWAVRMIGYNLDEGRRTAPVKVYGHEEVLAKLKAMCDMTLKYGDKRHLDKDILFIPVRDREKRAFGSFRAEFFDIYSKKARQMGYRLEFENGTSMVFSGDEPIDAENYTYLKDCDWLFSEAFCLYRDRDIYTPYAYHHNTVKESCELAEKFGIKHLALWHTVDAYGDKKRTLYLEEGRQYFSGDLVIPEDLDVINL